MSVLVVASELSDGVAHSEVPQLNGVIRTARQERVVSIDISKATIVEFDCMSVFLVAIIDRPDDLVSC